MKKYDDASWHYGNNFPEELTNTHGATHIGMFLAWCINRRLNSDELEQDFSEALEQVRNRDITGAEFLINICDEVFTSNELNDFGNEFAESYYNSSSGDQFADYFFDYANAFDEKAEKEGRSYSTCYHVEDTFENYDVLSAVLDKRFQEWLIKTGRKV